jgi:excinuclease UvrABC nuclease subunit
VLPLDRQAEFDAARAAEFFAALPARAGVFAVEMRDAGARAYLGRTADLRRRLARLLGEPEAGTKRLNLRSVAGGVRYRLTGSAFEQAVALYYEARALHPHRYRSLLRLRPPAMLKLKLGAEYPRCCVTRRISSDGALYFGPFPSRKLAEQFSSDFLNLFRLRRCQIRIRRDPEFPGCIYSEMKMCLAPCFAGCSKEEHDAEAARVAAFLETRGASLEAELATEREAASEALDFERAAAVHRRMEKVAEVLRPLPELPRPLEALDALILQPSAEPKAAVIFPLRGGALGEAFVLRYAELQAQRTTLEKLLRDKLSLAAEAGGGPHLAGREREEYLWLLARWFYSRPRAGEIFFRQPARGSSGAAEWPLRRISRACSRMLQPKEVAAAGE